MPANLRSIQDILNSGVPISKWSPIGSHTQNSTLSTVQSVTVPVGASSIILQVQTQNVRFTIDGTAPTSSKGFRVTAGNDPLGFSVKAGQVLKFIEEATSAVLDYQFVADA